MFSILETLTCAEGTIKFQKVKVDKFIIFESFSIYLIRDFKHCVLLEISFINLFSLSKLINSLGFPFQMNWNSYFFFFPKKPEIILSKTLEIYKVWLNKLGNEEQLANEKPKRNSQNIPGEKARAKRRRKRGTSSSSPSQRVQQYPSSP